MTVQAVNFLSALGSSKAVYRPQRTNFQPLFEVKNTFAGKTDLTAPCHADTCGAKKYLGDAVPGSGLCITA